MSDEHLRRPGPERPGLTEPQVYPEARTTGAKVEEHPRAPASTSPPEDADALMESIAYHQEEIDNNAARLYQRVLRLRLELRGAETKLDEIQQARRRR